MRFGKTLRLSIHPPWKDKYIDYAKLKSILREDKSDDDDVPWTEEDERRFGDEILNNQLENVARFQEETFLALRERVDAAFDTLKDLAPSGSLAEGSGSGDGGSGSGTDKGKAKSDITIERLKQLEAELDQITNEVKLLKAYSALNYTGFLKIVKKHDRKRGERYKIRPMMQARLAQRPFNSEQGYAPLLRKLSLLYFAIRQHLEDGSAQEPLPVDSEDQHEDLNGERYTAHKFWVHADNLLEVKTFILRRLPALVYSQQSAKEVDGSEDPRISSLYFDNSKFELYVEKTHHQAEAASLRVRWYGQLSSKPELFIEQKIVGSNGTSEERRFPIKEKYVKQFLDGDYNMEKSVQKMERQGRPAKEIEEFKSTVATIREFVLKNKLQPLMRANYVRTAFQKPADDRVRISIDTELVFVREDVLDKRHPCRDPDDWHRRDIDNRSLAYPFRDVNPSEISRFPHAVLEIKLKERVGDREKDKDKDRDSKDAASSGKDKDKEDSSSMAANSTAAALRRRPAWIEDLMASHLVHPVPRFSKFAHGVASLFDDYVNTLPFWLSDLEMDIRKDPQAAFLAEEQRRAQRAEDELVVGSFLGVHPLSFRPSRSSPTARSYLADRAASEPSGAQQVGGGRGAAPRSNGLRQRLLSPGGGGSGTPVQAGGGLGEEEEIGGPASPFPAAAVVDEARRNYGTLSSVLPGFSMTRFARAKREREAAAAAAAAAESALPEGVLEPTEWIKNAGPLRIEPKVWLANERTFLKWAHICVLLGALSVALYTAAGEDLVAEVMGVVYVLIAAFAGGWGYYMLAVRRGMIVARSGRDFDNLVGPLVVSAALMGALVLNFVFAYRAAYDKWDRPRGVDEAVAVAGAVVNVTAAAAAAAGQEMLAGSAELL